MEVKVARAGYLLRYTIGLHLYQEQNRKACCDIAPGCLRDRAANRLPGTATYTPKLLGLCRPLEEEKSKNGRSLVHFSIPSSLPTGHLEASWLHELALPHLVLSNHAAAESNLILPGGGGVGASRCDTVATALGKVRASTVETIRCKTHLCPPLPPLL
ncbi:uncharacterized protein TrAtP1_001000 [Trichoderma atroviride]|uniref:uncharacterized protein n=1 Tax=Hypocrea atroviridis TaxID=63577 RepID=UPI0033242029|nr:hypothetical protein TrAtP1_001000 [Trichoderma atroviride]